jgi:hypothetical protein
MGGKVHMRKEGRNGPMHVRMGTQGHPTQASPNQLSLSLSYSRSGGSYNYQPYIIGEFLPKFLKIKIKYFENEIILEGLYCQK